MFDTGTDLSWTQCVPCTNCSRSYYQPHDPSKSRTFRHLSCNDPVCEHANNTICIDGLCIFGRLYEDDSRASGYLVSDIFHLGQIGDNGYQFEQDVVFGCARFEHSRVVREDSTGILSLGIGSLSFVAQSAVDKFSYCVPAPERIDVDGRSASYLRFGSDAQISGKRGPFKQEFNGYLIYLKSVTYQRGSRLNQQQPVPIFAREEAAEYMPIFVDSGTTLLWLPGRIFYPLQMKIEEDISLPRRYFINLPSLYCYNGNMSDVEGVSVTLSFDGGADLELFGPSLFFPEEVDGANWVCLAAAAGDKAILGIYPQRNTNVGYGLSSMEIAFDRDGCV